MRLKTIGVIGLARLVVRPIAAAPLPVLGPWPALRSGSACPLIRRVLSQISKVAVQQTSTATEAHIGLRTHTSAHVASWAEWQSPMIAESSGRRGHRRIESSDLPPSSSSARPVSGLRGARQGRLRRR